MLHPSLVLVGGRSNAEFRSLAVPCVGAAAGGTVSALRCVTVPISSGVSGPVGVFQHRAASALGRRAADG